MSKKVKNIDLANALGKTNSAISYIKKHNPDEYKLIKMGYIAKSFLEDNKETTLTDLGKVAMFLEELKQVEN